ncbi:ATP/GTP-binding protein [Kutzneria sp. 744]|uniref:GTP-binding protein n=1 Tax=Kutzneria sp. (strain 744) TaxID=345341 RepID=UPI0004AFC202|nr:hypothetical protein [Kutzneria sp. 744]
MKLDAPNAEPAMTSATILVVGAPGVGKTAFLRSASRISPPSTVVRLGATADGLSGVAFEFSRIQLSGDLVVNLLSAASGPALWATWDHFARGAIGVVLLADACRLDTVSASIDFLARRHMPYLVAVTRLDQDLRVEDVRGALALSSSAPVVRCDARDRQSAEWTLAALVEHGGPHVSCRRGS